MGLILYHHNSSVCAAKIRMALAEKGLTWDSRLMRLDGDQFHPDYLALNPAAVVPTLVHGANVLVESNIILEYLDDAFPAPALRPADPALRARMRLWLAELDQGEAGVHKAISVLTYAIAYRHSMIAEAGSTDPGDLRAVLSRTMNPQSRSWLEDVVLVGTSSERFDAAVFRMERLCDAFESWLATTGWLAGSDLTLADLAFAPYFVRLELLGLSALWQNRPNVSAWYDRLRARPSMSEVLDWYAPTTLITLSEHQESGRTALEQALAARETSA